MRKSKKRKIDNLIKQGRLPKGSTGFKKSETTNPEKDKSQVSCSISPAEKISPNSVLEEWASNITNEKGSIIVADVCEQKVRRGMVFWFNLMPGFDRGRGSSPVFEVDGHTYADKRLLGHRPWLVVTDPVNSRSTVSAIPFTTGDYFESREAMACTLDGKSSHLVLSMIQPVHTAKLTKYLTWMTDEFMDKVNEALMTYFGVGSAQVTSYASKTDAMRRIESILDDVISSKVADLVKPAITDEDIEGALVKAMDTLRSRCVEAVNKASKDVDSGEELRPVSQIDKFYNRYHCLAPAAKTESRAESATEVEVPSAKKTSPVKGSFTPKKPGHRIDRSVAPFFGEDGVLNYGLNVDGKPCIKMRWDRDYAKMFFFDCKTKPAEEVLRIWRFCSIKSLYSARYTLRRRFPDIVSE